MTINITICELKAFAELVGAEKMYNTLQKRRQQQQDQQISDNWDSIPVEYVLI